MISLKKYFPQMISLIIVFSLSSLIAAPHAGADNGFVPVYRPETAISKASGIIKIDAELDDEGWKGACRLANFSEHNPGDQTKPAVDTEVLVAYDDEYLYVAWLCYDDPGSVRASFCERDKMFSDDYVILCIDTYGESAHAYELAVNPYGIPGDLLYSSTYGEDSSYDMIFESAGRITDFGWAAEMAIPFAAMRFPDRNEQMWKVDFWRNRPRESRFQYSWAAYDRDEDCWPCQWGTLKGINGIKSGKGLEILPSIVAHQAGSLGRDGGFENGDVMGDMSLGVSYDISSELTAEATVNPDFSQVEADVEQIDVNSTFALFYNERRPFFQEGSDLFNTYFTSVYTRSINDPIVAGKMTWRKGSNSFAFLTARDEHSVITLPFEERSRYAENGKSNSNILRYKRDFGKQSHLGLIATDRRFDGGGSGSLVGLDGCVRLSESNSFRFQVQTSYTKEVDDLTLVRRMDNPALVDTAFNETLFSDGKYTAGLDGEDFWGQSWIAALNRNTANYWGSIQYYELSPTFRADNGYEPNNNNRQATFNLGGVKRFENSKVLENIQADVNVAREWNFDNVRKDEWINTNLQMRFRAGQTNMHASYMVSNELFGEIQFEDIWQFHNCMSTQPNRFISFGGNINYGHRIARRELVMGKELGYSVWVDLRPFDRLLLETSYGSLKSNDLRTDELLFSQSIFWSRLSFQVSKEFSLRLVSQYNDRYDIWDIDPLITYRINPFTMFYIGSTHSIRDFNDQEDTLQGWHLTDRQYFMKIQYLFQL